MSSRPRAERCSVGTTKAEKEVEAVEEAVEEVVEEAVEEVVVEEAASIKG